ncbi:hypothetical protein [Tibeticola sp.]|uniref:hypothetical protein n=1 Tax=Tibeticola sp. TaxID=2005368 RepID=UPI002589C1F4|nr:hypothetical protein [Tibeticola sp.]MCI4440545.1 hypothetical protein [Tibeticola sp.]
MHWMGALLAAVLVSACGGGGGSSGSDPKTPTVQTTAPATLSMPLGVVQSYSVFGGVAPYSVSSSDVRVLNASVSDQTLILNSVGQGNATVTIRDRNGGSVAVAITVGDPLTLSMSSVQTYVGDTVKVLISGGTPPYRVSALDIALKGTIVGNELTLKTLSVGGPFDVVVLDARGQQAKMTVTTLAGSPQFNLAPAAMTISETSTEPLSLLISGGTSSYTVRTSDLTLLQPSANTVTGNTVTLLTGTKGNRCVNADSPVTVEIRDANGAHATSAITITDNPSGCGNLKAVPASVTVTRGSDASVLIQGQAANGTIRLVSSRTDIATVSERLDANGIAAVHGVAVGTTDIIVTDSAQPGVSLTFTVTVVAP